MIGDYGLPPGTALLGRAIGHAAAFYGDPVSDYTDILGTALRGRHSARDDAATRLAYVTSRARELIAQADSLSADPMSMAEWIGTATEIMRELTRDA